jgi:hypothetical protein
MRIRICGREASQHDTAGWPRTRKSPSPEVGRRRNNVSIHKLDCRQDSLSRRSLRHVRQDDISIRSCAKGSAHDDDVARPQNSMSTTPKDLWLKVSASATAGERRSPKTYSGISARREQEIESNIIRNCGKESCQLRRCSLVTMAEAARGEEV